MLRETVPCKYCYQGLVKGKDGKYTLCNKCKGTGRHLVPVRAKGK